MLFLLQCSLSCGGGVKSRSIKCVLEPQILCDPVTRPRSTTFCNLQSCFRTRPQPPTPTTTLGHDPDVLTSGPMLTPYTPTVSTPTPRLLHKDDQDFILVNNSSVEHGTHTGEDKEKEEEEGSTDLQQPPDRSLYTPGYDYIIEDEREDMFTLHTSVSTIHTPHITVEPDTTTTTHTHEQTPPKPARVRTTHNTYTLMSKTTPLSTTASTHRTTPKNSHTHKQKITQVQERTHSSTHTHSAIKKNKHTPRNTSKTKETRTGSSRNTVAFWVVGNWSEVKIFHSLARFSVIH